MSAKKKKKAMKTKWALFLVGKNSPYRNPKSDHIPLSHHHSKAQNKNKRKEGQARKKTREKKC
jgi:hypothetical protein